MNLYAELKLTVIVFVFIVVLVANLCYLFPVPRLYAKLTALHAFGHLIHFLFTLLFIRLLATTPGYSGWWLALMPVLWSIQLAQQAAYLKQIKTNKLYSYHIT